MFRIAVCDDEKSVREQLERILSGYTKRECLTDCFASGEELIKSENRYDVIFLDIDMAGINGIEAAKRLREKDKQVKIIYLTSYRDYVGSAFSVHAFGYMIKPIRDTAIYRQLDEAADYLKEEKDDPVFEFQTQNGRIRLPLSKICYFEYVQRKVVIHTEKAVYETNDTLKNMEERMKQYDFCMPHKSFLVNLYQVKSVKGYEIQMMDGQTLPLSQKKSVQFRERLNRYLANML